MSLIRTDLKARTEQQVLASGNSFPTGYGYGPAQLQSAYNLVAASAGNGGGATVAVVDAYNDPNAASDLATYRRAAGLSACTTTSGCFKQLNQSGGTKLPADAGSSGWDVEESLDIDMVSAICPNCKIDLIEAKTPSLVNLGTAADTAARLAGYQSNSYGASEFSAENSYNKYYDHPGKVVTVSAGDSGYGVSFPAASQYVTSVGGTSLLTAANARGWTETVWGSPAGGEGTGGGCSLYEKKPNWQKDSGCTKRTDNDVSADADPNTGVAIYDTYSQGGWLEVGGTSASSPMIASVYALAGTPTAGSYPAKYPYKDTAALWDVTLGADGSCSPAYLCTGEPGYDGPTGLGTPDGINAFKAP
jgi:subtilase family serine protease